ncbi:hypothetical protein SAMN05444271_103103 [Halohasta litchfieldiae]|jgi:hypothetical protein|uniref:Uncharacterized protein n=2 Tax=Halohasta litchfieldiae TaxID=1073996 RepID=A0A1H6S6B4_9EURY|nr:hypothetical protein SAMN05444271_103103 [Halohasta litchfieldiae]
MKKTLQAVGFMISLFTLFGIALGVLAFVSGSWAQSQLVTDAGGATDFGPIFIAIAYLQTAVIIFFLGPVIAALVGGLLGSVFSSPKTALITGGGGSLVGFYIMSVIALGVLVLSKGDGATQAFSFGQALVPMLVAGIPTAIMGSLVSALSSALN